MDAEALKKLYYRLVAPDIPNEWDVEEQLAAYGDCDEATCQIIFAQIPAIWPVSHSLCYNYLGMARNALSCIDTSQLDNWVRGVLDHYESGGLRAAQTYMAEIEANFLCTLRGEEGVTFAETTKLLLPYAQGLISPDIQLTPGPRIVTDTETITLPPLIREFQNKEDNFLLYKLIISYQWAFSTNQTLTTAPDDYRGHKLWLSKAMEQATAPDLLGAIYLGLESLRATHFLVRELPGLMRRCHKICRLLQVVQTQKSDPVTIFFHQLNKLILEPTLIPQDPEINALLTTAQQSKSAQDSFHQATMLHDLFAPKAGDHSDTRLPLYCGQLHLTAVNRVRQQKTQQLENRFVDELASFILTLPPGEQKQLAEHTEQKERISDTQCEESDTAVIIDQPLTLARLEDNTTTLFINLDNKQIPLPESLQERASAIQDHLGHIPDRYLSSAAGRAGSGLGRVPTPDTHDNTIIQAPFLYDEWDFRRKGFRKNWCAVIEKDLSPTRSNFMATTRARYRGQISKLHRQFEMLSNQERFVRHQTDGTDIDFDSLVESLADSRAGLAPSDRLFIRLQRNERDIAVLFLVDLSNSTEGWVGTAIKEALVLICEAMETVGDRYGIYGFSGMRRSRCEIFRVKELNEKYNEKTQGRIAALGPREYTRMGPAIRHMTHLFKGIDARLRLLITITDGKPEDYDDYKGEYAIEDTRHALIEAKSSGIHPFCITIDQQAHEYMGHMYGKGNYIFVNQVTKLPARMADMYRILTS